MSERNDAVNWGLVCHAAGLTFYIGLPVVGPLLIWLLKRKSNATADREGREAINFNLSFTIYIFVAGLLCSVFVGYVLLAPIGLLHLILLIWATLKANKGESVHYPLTLRFIR